MSQFQNKIFQKQIGLNLRNITLNGELGGCSYKSETQQEELGRDKPTMSRAARARRCLIEEKHNVKDCDEVKFVNNEQVLKQNQGKGRMFESLDEDKSTSRSDSMTSLVLIYKSYYSKYTIDVDTF